MEQWLPEGWEWVKEEAATLIPLILILLFVLFAPLKGWGPAPKDPSSSVAENNVHGDLHDLNVVDHHRH